MSFDSILIESTLENFVVFNILVVKLSSPLYFIQIEGSRVDRVHDLAVNGSGGALLNFCEL